MLPETKVVPLVQQADSIAEQVDPYIYTPKHQYKENLGYVRLPRSLLKDDLWLDFTLIEQGVFLKILELSWFLDEDFCMDDHGVLIYIKKGQCCYTIRKLTEILGKNYTKKRVEAAIVKLKKCRFLGQEVRHTKSIFTILHTDTYNMIGSQQETGKETTSGQDRDIKEEANKQIRLASSENGMEKSSSPPAFFPEEEKKSVSKYRFSDEEEQCMEKMMEYITKRNINISLKSIRSWSRKHSYAFVVETFKLMISRVDSGKNIDNAEAWMTRALEERYVEET